METQHPDVELLCEMLQSRGFCTSRPVSGFEIEVEKYDDYPDENGVWEVNVSDTFVARTQTIGN